MASHVPTSLAWWADRHLGAGKEYHAYLLPFACRLVPSHRCHRSESARSPDPCRVRTEQPLGRLVFELLEPRSSDGLLNWNVLDSLLEDATEYPILRTVLPFIGFP